MQASLTEASRALHAALEGEAYLDEVTIEVPHTWTEMDCKTPLSPACLSPSARKVSLTTLNLPIDPTQSYTVYPSTTNQKDEKISNILQNGFHLSRNVLVPLKVTLMLMLSIGANASIIN